MTTITDIMNNLTDKAPDWYYAFANWHSEFSIELVDTCASFFVGPYDERGWIASILGFILGLFFYILYFSILGGILGLLGMLPKMRIVMFLVYTFIVFSVFHLGYIESGWWALINMWILWPGVSAGFVTAAGFFVTDDNTNEIRTTENTPY